MKDKKNTFKILIPVLLGVVVIITAIFAKNITVQRSMSVTSCPAGQYLPEGSSTCTYCPANYYCTGTSATKTACPTNHTSQEGASSQSDCYITCSANHYKSNEGAYSCDVCPSGTTSQQHIVYYGQKSPTGTCKASSISVTCPAGQYLLANSSSSAGCSICPTGYYCPGDTFTQVSTLDQGKYGCPTGHDAGGSGKTKQGDCAMACAEGTYKSNPGATSCTSCPAGTWSTAHLVLYGLQSACQTFYCYACGTSNSGSYVWAASAPSGQSCREVSLSQSACVGNFTYSCYACGTSNSGSYVWAASAPSGQSCREVSLSQSACSGSYLVCPAGQYANNGTCTSCTGNTYTSSAGQTSCSSCPSGQVANSSHTGCVTYTPTPTPSEATYTVKYDKNNSNATGTTANSTHVVDVAKTLTPNGYKLGGYIFNGWNTKADGTGTNYADKASVLNLSTTNGATVNLYAKWSACSAGKYAEAGATSCSSCTGNTYTDTEGQSSCAACPSGQVANSTHTGCVDGTSTVVSCPAGTYLKANGKSAQDCTTCPEGFYCPGGEWNPSEEDQGQSACPEGHIDGGTGLTNENACKIRCDSGYYKDDNTASACVACPGDTTSDSHLVNYNQTSPEDACYSLTDEYNCYVCNNNEYTWTNKDLSGNSNCRIDATLDSSEKCNAEANPNDQQNPKTGLIRVGGVLVILSGIVGLTYFAIRKKMISNI